GGLIKEPLLSDYRMLNVHPSLLPRWRGAAPIERAIMAGDEVTGVTIMGVTAGLDSGPVYAQEGEEIRPQDSYGTLADRLQELSGALLVRVLDDLPEPVEQPEEGVTYAEKITPADRGLDPARPATELERQVRALSPHIGAQVRLDDGSELGVLAARAGPGGSGRPGTIDVVDRCPVLVCGEGALALLEVKPPGRQAMSGEAWLRGHRR
ncbi:MAG TPA: methionyl-tRNA formyltransferase, partial [Solirubrobacteraceae bacterium]|nr:methionyl-tRNA formyltransferase [Solirubrobacteraceae bacterium]